MKMESIWLARKKEKKLRPTEMLILTCMPKHKNYNHILRYLPAQLPVLIFGLKLALGVQ